MRSKKTFSEMERRLDANFYGCKIGLTTKSQIYYRKTSETKNWTIVGNNITISLQGK